MSHHLTQQIAHLPHCWYIEKLRRQFYLILRVYCFISFYFVMGNFISFKQVVAVVVQAHVQEQVKASFSISLMHIHLYFQIECFLFGFG